MYSYDCLYEPDQKYISTMVQRLFRLRRRIENNDWDFDYNRQHPTEEPRQKPQTSLMKSTLKKARRINSLYRKTKQYLQQMGDFR